MDRYTSWDLCRRHCRRVLVKKERETERERNSLTSAAALTSRFTKVQPASPYSLPRDSFTNDYTTPTSKRKKEKNKKTKNKK